VKIECPLCSKVLQAPEDHAPRPFCSARCKLADLNNWLNERYRILAEQQSDDDRDNHHYD
jgi:uncharacterized protein